MNEYHVNHVGEVCSPECQPAPAWLNVKREVIDALIAERNDLAAKVGEVRKFAELFGEVDGCLDRGFMRDTLLALLDGWVPEPEGRDAPHTGERINTMSSVEEEMAKLRAEAVVLRQAIINALPRWLRRLIDPHHHS